MSTKFLSQTIRKLSAGLWLAAIISTPARSAEAWVQRYGHTAGSSDSAKKVVTDNAGNVIVAGWSGGGNGVYDYATIKYSGAGVPLWTNRYDGPLLGDFVTGLAVDGSGNVFVTGMTYHDSDFFSDFATIKYSSTGVPLWTNLYSTGVGTDWANALGVDSDGNVIVTGMMWGDKFATIKYSGSGVPLWTNHYVANPDSFDAALALAVDSDGNVVVTGISYVLNPFQPDFLTIKYSGAGAQLWVNRYRASSGDTRGGTVAVDSEGNVVVTGISGGTGATIKYSSAGVPLWTNTSAGGGNAVAVDGHNNIVVTGGSATIKYSDSGVPLWTNRYDIAPGSDPPYPPYALAVDGNGNVVVTGASGNDVVTIRYSSAGMPLWTNRYNGPGNGLDAGRAVAVDGSGNVFVTGESHGGSSSNDFVTIKYSATALPAIPLKHQVVGGTIVLSWTNAAFSLQAAPEVQGSYTNIPAATSPYTTSLSGTRRYFRLAGN
jgi:hypothetical protein